MGPGGQRGGFSEVAQTTTDAAGAWTLTAPPGSSRLLRIVAGTNTAGRRPDQLHQRARTVDTRALATRHNAGRRTLVFTGRLRVTPLRPAATARLHPDARPPGWKSLARQSASTPADNTATPTTAHPSPSTAASPSAPSHHKPRSGSEEEARSAQAEVHILHRLESSPTIPSHEHGRNQRWIGTTPTRTDDDSSSRHPVAAPNLFDPDSVPAPSGSTHEAVCPARFQHPGFGAQQRNRSRRTTTSNGPCSGGVLHAAPSVMHCGSAPARRDTSQPRDNDYWPSRSTTTRRSGAGRPRIPSADRFDTRAPRPRQRATDTPAHRPPPPPTPPSHHRPPPRCNDSGERTVTKAPATSSSALSILGRTGAFQPQTSQVHEGASCSCRPLLDKVHRCVAKGDEQFLEWRRPMRLMVSRSSVGSRAQFLNHGQKAVHVAVDCKLHDRLTRPEVRVVLARLVGKPSIRDLAGCCARVRQYRIS